MMRKFLTVGSRSNFWREAKNSFRAHSSSATPSSPSAASVAMEAFLAEEYEDEDLYAEEFVPQPPMLSTLEESTLEDNDLAMISGILRKLKRRQGGRMKNYNKEELEYLSGRKNYAGLVDLSEQLRQYVAEQYGEGNVIGFGAANFEAQLKSEFELLRDNASRQLQIEEGFLDSDGTVEMQRGTNGLLTRYYKPLLRSIENEVEAIKAGKSGIDRAYYGGYFLLMSPEQMAMCALQSFFGASTSTERMGEQKVVTVAIRMGRALEQQLVQDCTFKESQKFLKKSLFGEMGGGKNNSYNSTKTTASLRRSALKILRQDDVWSLRTHAKVGSALLKLMLESLTVDMDLDDPRLQEYLFFEKYMLPRPKWMTQYTKGLMYDVAKKGGSIDEDESMVLRDAEAHATSNEEDEAEDHLALLNGAISSNIPGESIGDDKRSVPALYHTYSCKNGRRFGLIRLHPKVIEEFRSMNTLMDINNAKYKPMLVPPLPWVHPDRGGYLALPSKLIRMTKTSLLSSEINGADMSILYKGLNSLAKVPWRINNDVLEVVESVWPKDLKFDFAGLPATSGLLPSVPLLTGNMRKDQRVLLEHRRSVYEALKKTSELHSMQCDTNIKINTAMAFRESDAIYFPQNIDFRGRVYPITPNFNHLGNDLNRALLKFSKSKRLGKRGLYWLKIHASNLFGFDKAPFDDRAAYIDERMDKLIDSAERPLDGQQWWLEADSPWQALATAKELAAAMKLPEPEEYMSNLPVHQDGSCNGLQHYAALGRDVDGARAVNLLPSGRPQDVYSRVLDIVKKTVQLDQMSSDKNKALMAQSVVDMLERKVVKQTVMTSVYGVTFVGARQQIFNRIREKVIKEDWDPTLFTETFQYKCSIYLARVVLDSIGELFSSAKGIMGWLANVAEIVAQQDEPMSWISPVGLPVIQPYRRNAKKSVHTSLQTIQIVDDENFIPINKRKQSSAFPPNFVHSLDSAHMLMTAIRCEQANLDFAAVHDSYWTHAGDTDEMNMLLRESFIDLYETNILEDLMMSLKCRFPGVEFPEIPQRGELDMSEVKSSLYFFS